MVDLTGAEVIVSVGRGISKNVEEGIKLAKELAAEFNGGVVGGSRAATDAGWLTVDHQVGQTGVQWRRCRRFPCCNRCRLADR